MAAPETLAEARAHRKVNPPAVEVFYLARIGAFRYLDAIAEALRERRSDGKVESVPEIPPDTGLVVRRPPRNRGEDLGAFRVYGKAERDALAGIAKADAAELDYVTRRLAAGIAEGVRVRANLLAKGCPVPGRGRWLAPDGEAA